MELRDYLCRMENITTHKIFDNSAIQMHQLGDNSIDLVVTSPPYPMIEMWDDILSEQNNEIKEALVNNNGMIAFELMHQLLDKVWSEVTRVVKPGGFVCINIGDAARTINGNFALYPNHSRIISYFCNNGFNNLPNIIWRKQTNSPNKFMGSGMLPAGAYVTLEHEWILIFRKGSKKEYRKESEKHNRRESSYFWEERNIWFSDLWENIKGIKQNLTQPTSRSRTAAFPIGIPYRLINMYSVIGDTVLDPFLGTGTTSLASIISKRNSIGYEIDNNFAQLAVDNIKETSASSLNKIITQRIEMHKQFINKRNSENKEIKHFNNNLNLPVVTNQEKEIKFSIISENNYDNFSFTTSYKD